jgi:hypothetical protein
MIPALPGEQRHAADVQLACLSCKACRWRRFVRAADAQRSAASVLKTLSYAKLHA